MVGAAVGSQAEEGGAAAAAEETRAPRRRSAVCRGMGMTCSELCNEICLLMFIRIGLCDA